MIVGKDIKTAMLAVNKYPLREVHTAWFVICWPEVRAGTAQPRQVERYGMPDLAMFFEEDEPEGEEVSISLFIRMHYKDLLRQVFLGRVLVLDEDPPRLIHRNDADYDDFMNRLDRQDSLSVVREIRELYG